MNVRYLTQPTAIMLLLTCMGCAASGGGGGGGAPPPPPPPTSAQAGTTTLVAIAPPAAPQQTLPEFLGLKGLFKGIGAVAHKIHDRLANIFPDLKKIPSPDQLPLDADPATEAAAQIQKDEQQAAGKIKALRYLGSIGCGCYPGVEEAFLAALDDCMEVIRYEAVKALRSSAGSPCKSCKAGACCGPLLIKRLDEIAHNTDLHGCYIEPSPRVRRMARLALQGCGGMMIAPLADEPEFPDEGPPHVDVPLTRAPSPAPQSSSEPTPAIATAPSAPHFPVQRTAFVQTLQPAAAGDFILAHVNQEPITQGEIDRLVEPRLAALAGDLTQAARASLRETLVQQELDRAIDRKVLSQEARRHLPAWEMATIMTVAVSNHQSLPASGSDQTELAAAIAEQALARHWLQKQVQDPQLLTDEELRDYYQANLAQYRIPAAVRWEKISVMATASISQEQARGAIQYLRRRIQGDKSAQPPLFVSAATSTTQDWTQREELESDAIAGVLFSLPVGQISPAIQDADGWHLVRVLEARPARTFALAESAESIRRDLAAARADALQIQYLEDLRRGAQLRFAFEGNILRSPENVPAVKHSARGELRRLPDCAEDVDTASLNSPAQFFR